MRNLNEMNELIVAQLNLQTCYYVKVRVKEKF